MSKYSRTFKIALAQQCLDGVSSPRVLGKQLSIPYSQIRYWSKVYSFNGEESFLPPKFPRTAKNKADILKSWQCKWLDFVDEICGYPPDLSPFLLPGDGNCLDTYDHYEDEAKSSTQRSAL